MASIFNINQIVAEMAKEQALPLACQAPDGGMAVWLNVQTNADALMHQLAKSGVHVTSESLYCLKPGKPEHLRLGFANQSPEESDLSASL